VLVGVEGSLVFGGIFFLGLFGMSVGIAVFFIGTWVFLTVALSFNLNFRQGWQLGLVRVCVLHVTRLYRGGGIEFSVVFCLGYNVFWFHCI
jgi:hypothetical protein